ncbi:MAG TPA: hypothetical protein VL967_14245 [Terracidiphilus sp.]|nr:hypothetical protein [Terracidiphilus sp.]
MPPIGAKQEQSEEARDGEAKAAGATMKTRGRSLEVTGLGIVAALIFAFGSLVSDGTVQVSQYLVFLVFMLVSAAGLVWRIVKLTPGGTLKTEARVPAGSYRVSFGGPGRR